MLHDIRHILTRGNWRSIVDWHRCIAMMQQRIDVWKQRYIAGPLDYSSAVNRLRYVINGITDDIPYLLKMDSDDTRYVRGVVPLASSLRNAINPIYSNSTPTNLFTDRSMGTDITEIVIQTERKLPLSTLPMNQPYEAWRGIKPIRIWYHNSTELVHRLEPHAVTFHYDVPTELVVAVDLHVLLMKYLKYCQANNNTHNAEQVDRFIHSEIIPDWYDDLLRIWTMNVMMRYLEDPGFKDKAIATFTQKAHYILTENNLKQAFADLEKELELLKDGNIRPEDFLNTKWFGNRQSLLNMIDELENDLTAPVYYQHIGVYMVLQFPILKIALLLCSKYKNPTSDRIAKTIRASLYRLSISNVASTVRNPKVRAQLEHDIEELKQLVNVMVKDLSGIDTPVVIDIP